MGLRNHLLVIEALACLFCCVIATSSEASDSRKFLVSGAARRGNLGFSVALNETLGFAGAIGGVTQAGKGYLFDLTTGQKTITLTPSVSRSDDLFGFNAELSTTQLLVGDPGNPYDPSARPQGAAYVFDPTTGTELHRLLPTDGFAGDEFGYGINLFGNRGIIGAPAWQAGPGAAYLFDLGTGAQLQKFVPTDPLIGSDFGCDVAVSSELAIVGARGDYDTLGLVKGNAYVFDVTTGQQLHKLSASDGLLGDEFGFDVAIQDELAVIGAPSGGAEQGAAYVFDARTGTQIAKLLPPVRQNGDDFGSSVDIFGDRIIVGASGLDTVRGAVHVYHAKTFEHLASYTPSDVAVGDAFGTSVSIYGNRMFVGSPNDDDVTFNAGAAYLFELPDLVLAGDFDRNGELGVEDIDALTQAVKAGTHPEHFDVTGDGLVNQADREYWVNELKNTYFGDANLDGVFTSSDMITMFQIGQYEDDIPGNSNWTAGDFSGDCDFTSTDMIVAFQSGGYEAGPRAALSAVAVPEPAGIMALFLGLVITTSLLRADRIKRSDA